MGQTRIRRCVAAAVTLASALTFASSAAATDLKIVAFRSQGPGSDTNEWLVVQNAGNTATTLTGDNQIRFQRCEGTTGLTTTSVTANDGRVVPAGGYILFAFAGVTPGGLTPDYTYNNLIDTVSFPATGGFRLQERTGTGNSFETLDTVGAASANATCREGAGIGGARTGAFAGTTATPTLSAVGQTDHEFVRRTFNGNSFASDTDANQNDFILVDNFADDNTFAGDTQGQVNPRNSTSPRRTIRNGGNSNVTVTRVQTNRPASVRANRALDKSAPGASTCTASPPANCGLLYIRRKITNNTGATITSLRFRADLLTTFNPWFFPALSGPADLRPQSSTETSVTINNTPTTLVPATLVTAPTASEGGGINSVFTVALPGGGLTNGSSINVSFRFAVQSPGPFRVGLSPEILP